MEGSFVSPAGSTKTEATRQALLDRRMRLKARTGRRKGAKSLERFLEKYVWPGILAEAVGRPVTRKEEDAILGYGPGVISGAG